MRRLSKKSPSRLFPDSQRLIAFAREVVNASCMHEKRLWEQGMELVVQKQLKSGRQEVLDAALGQLQNAEYFEYDTLLQMIEALSECCKFEYEGVRYDVLLVVAPVLAWTRYSIAHGAIPPEVVQEFGSDLAAHVLSPQARYFVAPQLFAIDHLPQTHVKTAQLTRDFAHILFDNKAYQPLKVEQEPPPFLADTRNLLAVVAVPEGKPLFGWQVDQNPVTAADFRVTALNTWQEKSKQAFSHLLPGCHIDLMLPGAFFSTCRRADIEIRPALIQAAVSFLTQTLEVELPDLRAVIAPFGELSSDMLASEYRIGFARHDSRDILYGVVWPLYAQEESDEESAMPASEGTYLAAPTKSPLETILLLLKEQGVLCDCVHQERFPMEYCDDCGVPMFADHAGELVHAEMPEEVSPQALQLH